MIESDFCCSEGSKTVRFSERQFQTVVQALGWAAGDLFLGPKPVEQQRFMGAQHAGHFLDRFDAGAQGAVIPPLQEPSRPQNSLAGPEELKIFLEQIGADGPEVVTQQIRQLDFLLGGQMLGSFQQAPSAMGQNGFHPLAPS